MTGKFLRIACFFCMRSRTARPIRARRIRSVIHISTSIVSGRYAWVVIDGVTHEALGEEGYDTEQTKGQSNDDAGVYNAAPWFTQGLHPDDQTYDEG